MDRPVFALEANVTALRAAHGATWEIWGVPTYAGPDAYCTRQWGAPAAQHVAHSAEELDAWIRSQS